jgi:hypothetical protein
MSDERDHYLTLLADARSHALLDAVLVAAPDAESVRNAVAAAVSQGWLDERRLAVLLHAARAPQAAVTLLSAAPDGMAAASLGSMQLAVPTGWLPLPAVHTPAGSDEAAGSAATAAEAAAAEPPVPAQLFDGSHSVLAAPSELPAAPAGEPSAPPPAVAEDTPLHAVLRRGGSASLDIAEAYLAACPAAGARVNGIGRTPLHELLAAAWWWWLPGDNSAASEDQGSQRGATPQSLAARTLAMVAQLAAMAAAVGELDGADAAGDTPLRLLYTRCPAAPACASDSRAAGIAALLAAGASANATVGVPRGTPQSTPPQLTQFAQHNFGELRLVTRALSQHALRTPFAAGLRNGTTLRVVGVGSTPLHDAAAAGDAALIVTLLAAGAAVDARDKEGYTPLLRLLENGPRAVADAATGDHDAPIAAALDALRGAGADVFAVTPACENVLHLAAMTGRVGTLRSLALPGMRLACAVPSCDAYMLHYGVWSGHVPTVTELLNRRVCARLSGRVQRPGGPKFNVTPMGLAVRRGNIEVVRLLVLRLGALATHPRRGFNPTDWCVTAAAEVGDLAMMQALRELGMPGVKHKGGRE